jgi:uncharacterized protein (DUF952 family)
MADAIYHLADAAAWPGAMAAGQYHGTAFDRQDGFIHFSSAAEVRASAAKHRAGRDDVVLVAVDPARLGTALKWEAARGGVLFPHLYGPLDTAAVLWAVPLPLGPDGVHQFPETVAP